MKLGQLDFNHGSWQADMQPHVAIAFKRLFGQIRSAATPPFELADRPDIAADLDWFMMRYPFETTEVAKARLDDQNAIYRATKLRVEELIKPDWQPPLITGFRDGEAPMPYQTRAAALVWETKRLLLLDDVGLGKTVSSLTTIAGSWGLPAAIVVQPHLSGQWVKFIERFTHLTAFEVKDRNVRTLPPADVYVFRYSNIGAWATYAAELGCKTVIFDEIQELRHGRSTDKGMGAYKFAEVAENRMGLTATPIYNYGSEIFNVVEFIAPGALGRWDEFIINWCTSHGSHWIVENPTALGAYLQGEGIALRRTVMSAEVKSSLPPLAEPQIVEMDWCEGDAETDRDLQKKLALRVMNGSFHERGEAARQLDLMMRHETGVGKARSVAAYVRMLLQQDEPVLLAGWHRAVYDIWLKELADHRPVMFTGTESTTQKRKAKEAIVSGQSNLIIMSLRSGAGLDGLQERGGGHVVFGEFDWSPQVHVQVIGRLFRTGQTKTVTPHYPFVNEGSDPVLMEMLGLKASQSEGILNPYSEPVAQRIKDTRVKQLAKSVLGWDKNEVVPIK